MPMLVLLAMTIGVSSAPDQDHLKCGYQSCPLPREGYLNIHMVPHTHNDVGWLKTFDQYYYGNLLHIQDAGVQYILDSVVQELIHDPRKRFIYVETSFFWKWWKEQTDIIKNQVKSLVNRGQLEFVGGAWCMHDEACTLYQAILDQSTWGFKRLMDTFGECGRPRVGWQIDPFGHSRVSANLMAHYGFDGLFLGRIDWEDKNYRLKNLTAEMLWLTSPNDDSESSQLFTSVLCNTYSAPRGFCFDINCHDEPVVDNKKSPMYNANERALEFIDIVKQYFEYYKTNHVIVTMGEDFMYMNAHMNFKNMDKLIYHINDISLEDLKVYAFYSTPSCYLKAVHNSDITLPEKRDDFFPYSSDPMSFWTGFYTSRPTLKYFARLGNNYLQVCKQLFSLAKLGTDHVVSLDALREAVGTLQHHDAITGTEREQVAYDYARILDLAFKESAEISNRGLNNLMRKGDEDAQFTSCLLLNISSCPLTEKCNRFVVTVYNPLSRPVTYPIKLPVCQHGFSYSVLCPKGNPQEVQIVKVPDFILNVPGRRSYATAHLIFLAKDIPPLGFLSYNIFRKNSSVKVSESGDFNWQPTSIGFKEDIIVKIDSNGKVNNLVTEGTEICLKQDFFYYEAFAGNNEVFANRSSGAYIFRPKGSALPIYKKPLKVKIFRGPLVHEVHQILSDWVCQVIRVYKGFKHAEFQWLVGPIPIDDGIGKEVITRYSTDSIHSNGEFLTDSNGKEYILRRLNHRPSWPVELFEKIPGNYYPVTTTLSINDDKTRLSILTDRSQGGSSLKDGEMELMLHRRLLRDDAFGVGEPLNEIAFDTGLIATGSHFVTTSNISSVRLLVQERVLMPWIFLSDAKDFPLFEDWSKHFKTIFCGLQGDLPINIQILTFEPWSGFSYLLRLEHIMEHNDDPNLSKPVSIDLNKVFANLEVIQVEEMMLGANLQKKDSRRFVWLSERKNRITSEEDEDYRRSPEERETTLNCSKIILNPMQIRTFIVHFKK